jgi:DNA-binding MarR family transcriptional regulator
MPAEGTMTFKEYLPDPKGEFAVAAPEYFFYLLFQTSRRRDVALDAALVDLGLTATDARTLAIIRRTEGCTMNELAKYSAVDRTTLTREIDRLVALGLVSRQAHASDRRRVRLMLTDHGEAVYAVGLPQVAALGQRALQGVEAEDLRQFARTLQTIIRNLVDDGDWAEEVLQFARSKGLRPID